MHFRPLLPLLAALGLVAQTASAQWVTESYPLKPGWNAIWLSHDCSDRTIKDLLAAAPNTSILEVWRWNPLGSTVQFTQSPSAPIKPDTAWAVWRRTDPNNSTLSALTGNAAYLVNVLSTASPFTLQLLGKPLPPTYQFSSSGLNFLGFPAQTPDSTTQRNFDTVFSFSSVLKSNPSVFFYNGGPLSDVNPKNPLLLATPRFTAISRGKAYWVKSGSYADYYGPIQVTVLGLGGIDFGKKLSRATVRVKNVTDPVKNQTVTATFTLANSQLAPDSSPFTQIATGNKVRARGALDASLQYEYSNLPASLTLLPGEEKDLVLSLDRSQLTTPGASYLGILQVADDLGQTRIDLPVSATGTSRTGLWVGAAVLDSVHRVETLSGPETDAPLSWTAADRKSSSMDLGASAVTTTNSTTGGQTTSARTFHATFNTAGDAYLDTAVLAPAIVTVTGPAGVPTYVQATHYTIVPSLVGTVTNPGSGYTSPPDVTLTGGGGTGAQATATLSAGVQSVSIDPAKGGSGGSGYTTAPTVTFSAPTGAGGTAATGFAVVKDDIVTDVTVTNGGSGYAIPPSITFAGGGGSGAVAAAKIVGSVGSVTITQPGAGYTAAPVVSFVPKPVPDGDGKGSGAGATVQRSGGAVTGVSAIHKVSATVPATVRITISTVSAAPAGTPDSAPTVSVVTSVKKLVTLNGKSHLSTRRTSTGSGAAAPSLFPVRLILHATASGAPTLLQQVYLGERAGATYAGPEESVIAPLITGPMFAAGKAVPAGKLGRVSSASFPHVLPVIEGRGRWTGLGALDGTATFTVALEYNDPTNPFLHTYHPDHDNWDARYENNLVPKRSGVPSPETYNVSRAITLAFSSALPAGVSDLDWGVTALGGTYSETISNLRYDAITVSGSFILHQVSEVATLTPP